MSNSLRRLDDLKNFSSDFLDRVRSCASRQFVRERGAVLDQFLLGNVVPDWEQNLIAGYGARNQSVQFVVRPPLAEEVLR